jgi:hypothetical protein
MTAIDSTFWLAKENGAFDNMNLNLNYFGDYLQENGFRMEWDTL